jgi:hypothetical protein
MPTRSGALSRHERNRRTQRSDKEDGFGSDKSPPSSSFRSDSVASVISVVKS